MRAAGDREGARPLRFAVAVVFRTVTHARRYHKGSQLHLGVRAARGVRSAPVFYLRSLFGAIA